MQRVVAAHDALQLRKLADHAGQQIRLRKPGGPLGKNRIRLQGAGNPPRKQLDALHAIQLGAELVVIDHPCEVRHARFQPDLAVLVVEEARVLEARPHHALVAADDMARIGHPHVRHDQELRLQLPAGVEQREVLLVLAHGQDQAFLRHLEERRIELPGVHARVFDQRSNLVQKIGVLVQPAAFAPSGLSELLFDLGPARREVRHHHALGAQALLVLVGAFEADLARTHEAVSARVTSGVDVENGSGNDAFAMQHHQSMHRPHELRLARSPTHHLGDGQRLERVLDDRGKRFFEHRAFNFHARHVYLALRRCAPLQTGDGNAGFAGKPGHRLLRRLR